MIVEDALNRMNEILDTKELTDVTNGEMPKDASVKLENATFSYEESKGNAVDGVSLDIRAGEHIGFLG